MQKTKRTHHSSPRSACKRHLYDDADLQLSLVQQFASSISQRQGCAQSQWSYRLPCWCLFFFRGDISSDLRNNQLISSFLKSLRPFVVHYLDFVYSIFFKKQILFHSHWPKNTKKQSRSCQLEVLRRKVYVHEALPQP